MKGIPRNRGNQFNVSVSFPSHSFGVRSLKEVPLTPRDVLDELEAICIRIRTTLAVDAIRENTPEKADRPPLALPVRGVDA